MTRLVFALLIYLLLSVNANAKGVLASTEIVNSATLEYQVGNLSLSAISNDVIDRVDQLIDVNIVWQDVSSVAITSGDNNRILTYKITNTGNGKDTFSLTYIHDSTSDFAINNPRIYADTNNNGIFDISIDQQVSQIILEADASSILFLISDIPSTIYPNSSKSKNILSATSNTGCSGTAGTSYAGAGINGVVAIDGMNGGKDRDTGIYEIKNLCAKLASNNPGATVGVQESASNLDQYSYDAQFNEALDVVYYPLPIITVNKNSCMINDHVNGTTNPKRIPVLLSVMPFRFQTVELEQHLMFLQLIH